LSRPSHPVWSVENQPWRERERERDGGSKGGGGGREEVSEGGREGGGGGRERERGREILVRLTDRQRDRQIHR